MKTLKNNKKVKLPNKQILDNRSIYYARWIALYEAINIIADEAEQRNKKFDSLKLSPVKIKKYISSVEDQIQRKLDGDFLNATSV
jgi:hypothetical protein